MRDNQLTFAGFLFCIESQAFRSAFYVRTVSFLGNDMGNTQYRRKPEDITGPISEMYKQGMQYLKSSIHYPQNDQGFNSYGGVPEVSIIALEELLQNALISRLFCERTGTHSGVR
jgi:predicted HTH transcriptional regulator